MSTPNPTQPLYLHLGTGEVDPALWTVAEDKSEEGSPLYHYAQDAQGGSATGASDEWRVYALASADAAVFQAATDAATAPVAEHRPDVPETEAEAWTPTDAGSTVSMPENPTAEQPVTVTPPEGLPDGRLTASLPGVHADTTTGVVADVVALEDDAKQLLTDIHAKVTEIHATISELAQALPGFGAALEGSPFGKMFGGLFGK